MHGRLHSRARCRKSARPSKSAKRAAPKPSVSVEAKAAATVEHRGASLPLWLRSHLFVARQRLLWSQRRQRWPQPKRKHRPKMSRGKALACGTESAPCVLLLGHQLSIQRNTMLYWTKFCYILYIIILCYIRRKYTIIYCILYTRPFVLHIVYYILYITLYTREITCLIT